MLFCISIGKKAISSIERIEYIQICDKQDVKHGKSKKKKTWLRVLCEYSMYARSSPSSAYHRLGLAHAGLAEFFCCCRVCGCVFVLYTFLFGAENCTTRVLYLVSGQNLLDLQALKWVN